MKSRSHFLPHDQRSHLMALQRQERDVKINDRIKTILLLDDGLSYEEVARVLFLSKETIIRYEKTYLEEDGVESLCRLNYSGKPCELNGTQLEQVKSHVKKIHQNPLCQSSTLSSSHSESITLDPELWLCFIDWGFPIKNQNNSLEYSVMITP